MPDTFSRLGIAVGLGLLVGLQRERTDARLAGFRTFPLVTILGALTALLGREFGGWIVAVGMGGLAVVILGGNLPLVRGDGNGRGVTSEVTMLVMFAIGAYLMVGSTAVAIVTCGVVAVLLHLKPQLHLLAEKIGDRDFTAIMQFALISLVVLPVLPNRAYGPFGVLNPFMIWLMVVLIVGISLGGYIAYKLVGARAGAVASGVLGGLISSTATTFSLARRGRASGDRPGTAAFVILTASAIVFVRIGILIGATAPGFLRSAAVPLTAMFLVLAVVAWTTLPPSRESDGSVPEQTNPTELRSAILFGALYAAVLLATAVANARFGHYGLLTVAAISGLTDMDAITLSVTHLVSTGEIAGGAAWRVILVAALANFAFKGAIVALLGHRRLFVRVGLGFGIAAITGIVLIHFGPG